MAAKNAGEPVIACFNEAHRAMTEDEIEDALAAKEIELSKPLVRIINDLWKSGQIVRHPEDGETRRGQRTRRMGLPDDVPNGITWASMEAQRNLEKIQFFASQLSVNLYPRLKRKVGETLDRDFLKASIEESLAYLLSRDVVDLPEVPSPTA